MKLWNNNSDIDQRIESFTIGNDPAYDIILAPYDVQGSLAHAAMLHKINYLTAEEYSTLKKGLQEIATEIQEGKFSIENHVEDVHSQVEKLLTDRYGEVGKKLHVGRSRNDQVAVDLKLYYRNEISNISEQVKSLAHTFLLKAEETKEVYMPGYTHTQVGMVSSFGLWYSSYAEALADDLALISSIRKIVDQNPLGSAAGYGSSLPNDRDATTYALGFGGMHINSIYAQNSRGKSELMIGYIFSNVASTLNRWCNDTISFCNENYGFLKLPEDLTTGSSIMPHKKNPDVIELIRAKCNQLSSVSLQVQNITSNLMTGYHRDYQLLKEIIFPAFSTLKSILELTTYCIPSIVEKKDIMDDDKYAYCYSVEKVNAYVKDGISFRDAYHKVKAEIAAGSFNPDDITIEHTHIGSMGNLGIERIKEKINQVSKFLTINSQ